MSKQPNNFKRDEKPKKHEQKHKNAPRGKQDRTKVNTNKNKYSKDGRKTLKKETPTALTRNDRKQLFKDRRAQKSHSGMFLLKKNKLLC